MFKKNKQKKHIYYYLQGFRKVTFVNFETTVLKSQQKMQDDKQSGNFMALQLQLQLLAF